MPTKGGGVPSCKTCPQCCCLCLPADYYGDGLDTGDDGGGHHYNESDDSDDQPNQIRYRYLVMIYTGIGDDEYDLRW